MSDVGESQAKHTDIATDFIHTALARHPRACPWDPFRLTERKHEIIFLLKIQGNGSPGQARG